MKRAFCLFILSIFLISCSAQIPSSQKLIDLSSPNQTQPIINQTEKPIQINITKPISNASKTASQTSSKVIKKEIKGMMHTIEVIDVTEDGRGCLIKVDGTTILINKDDTGTVNGVRIHVLDVRLLHSDLEDNDLCELLIY